MLQKLACLAFGLTLAAPAFADTHIGFVDQQGTATTQLYVKGGKVRIEQRDGQAVSLYDTASNSVTVLLPGQKQYIVMDSQSMSQMGSQFDAAQRQAQTRAAQNQAQMDQADQETQGAEANLTPQQKAAMAQVLAHRPQAGPTTPGDEMTMSIHELGTRESVDGHGCRDVQVMMNNKLVSTDCIVDSPAALGIAGADLKTLQAMRTGMQNLMQQMGPMGKGMMANMGSGFAIKVTHQTFRNMQMVDETDSLKSISSAGLDASLFSIPAGYTQTTFQEMMKGGHP